MGLICFVAVVLAGCGRAGDAPSVQVADYIKNARGALQSPSGPAYAKGFSAGLTAASDVPPPPAPEMGRQGSVYSTGFQIARELLAKGDDPEARAAIDAIRAMIREQRPQSDGTLRTQAPPAACRVFERTHPGLTGLLRRPDV